MTIAVTVSNSADLIALSLSEDEQRELAAAIFSVCAVVIAVIYSLSLPLDSEKILYIKMYTLAALCAMGPTACLWGFIFHDNSKTDLMHEILAATICTSWTMFFLFPDRFVHFVSSICPPLARYSAKFSPRAFKYVTIKLSHRNLETYWRYLDVFGRLVYQLELHSNEVKGENLCDVLEQCTNLKRLYLVDVDIHDFPLNDVGNLLEIKSLRFIRCVGGD